MAYATIADLTPARLTHKQLLELTSEGSAEVNVTTIETRLEEASGTVEAYCRNRYVTPLQPSDVVKAMVLDIAVYLLRSRTQKPSKDDVARDRYTDAIRFLEGVASGKFTLDQPVNATAQASSGAPAISSRRKIFNCI